MLLICGWCPDAGARTKAAVERGETVTHGMCPNCTHKFEAMIDDRAGMKVLADLTSHGPAGVAPAQRVIE